MSTPEEHINERASQFRVWSFGQFGRFYPSIWYQGGFLDTSLPSFVCRYRALPMGMVDTLIEIDFSLSHLSHPDAFTLSHFWSGDLLLGEKRVDRGASSLFWFPRYTSTLLKEKNQVPVSCSHTILPYCVIKGKENMLKDGLGSVILELGGAREEGWKIRKRWFQWCEQKSCHRWSVIPRAE